MTCLQICLTRNNVIKTKMADFYANHIFKLGMTYNAQKTQFPLVLKNIECL